MSLKFKGTLAELQQIVERMGERGGPWTDVGNGTQQMRTLDGGFINWWPHKGTLTCQGSAEAKKRLEDGLALALSKNGAAAPSGRPAGPAIVSDERKGVIFVVHGHDSEARDQLELALHRLGLRPFILMNSSGGGKTIIEALEGKIGRDYTSDFGIALFTPDDIGYSKADGGEKAEPRARQNVVLETGMLLASLTRERMALLVKGHVEMPSDLQGIIQLRFNNHVKEIMGKLCSRLQEAGIPLDATKIAFVT